MPSPGWSLQVPLILREVVRISHNPLLSSVKGVVGTISESGEAFVSEDFLVKKESFYSRSLELQGVSLICKESYPPGGVLLAMADVVQVGC
ncbi:UNVERIFIED_CONTAM: hypothetical protein Sradi_3147300 [Sesamum radiatum]|uniref:Uncharacterized protein n=1 Tax=Sesamum radiatum TaxID=300843 RepID=A0AAW2REM1_SESRA